MPFGVAAAGLASGVGQGIIGGIFAGKQQDAVSKAAAQERADLQPWVTTGTSANTDAADLLGLNGQDAATAAMAKYQTSPGYQFQLDQGLRAVDAGAAGKGILRSGATLKAEQTFGQGLADSDFGNYYNRLMDMSKLGQTSATGQANASQTLGSQQAAIFGNEAKGLSSDLGSILGNTGVQSGLNKLFSAGTSSPFGVGQGGAAPGFLDS